MPKGVLSTSSLIWPSYQMRATIYKRCFPSNNAQYGILPSFKKNKLVMITKQICVPRSRSAEPWGLSSQGTESSPQNCQIKYNKGTKTPLGQARTNIYVAQRLILTEKDLDRRTVAYVILKVESRNSVCMKSRILAKVV